MSRSNPTERAINPAKKWFQWDSDSKGFKYYDKEAPHPTDAAKKGANILVPLPFRFLVLDTLHTIGGFSDADGSGIYSNEIRDLKKQVLEIRIKKDVVCTGLYDDIKGKVTGSKYAQSVYIAYFEGAELQIGNIKIMGSALGSWIEFCKKNKPTEGGLVVSKSEYVEKNKKVNWNQPVFEKLSKISPETDAKAIELDKVLQEYLTQYFSHSAAATTTPVTEVDTHVGVKSETPETDALLAEGNKPVSAPAPSFEDDDLPF